MLEYPEVQEAMNKIFESYLQNMGIVQAVSKAHTRLDLIEEHLGADDDYCIVKDLEYGEREPLQNIRDQITTIYTVIDSKETVVETTILGGNKTEMRARLLFDKIKTVPYLNGKKIMKGPDVSKWLVNEITAEYKATKTGARQAAKDVMEKTRELYPDDIRVNPDSSKRNQKRAYNIIEYIERENL